MSGQNAGPRSAGADPGRTRQWPRSAARVEVKALLKELRRMGKTILISSHILTELGRLLHVDRDHRTRPVADAAVRSTGLSSDSPQPHRRNPISDRRRSGAFDSAQQPNTCDRSDIEPHQVVAELETDDEGLAESDGNVDQRRRADAVVQRPRPDAGRRLHDGHQGAGDVA